MYSSSVNGLFIPYLSSFRIIVGNESGSNVSSFHIGVKNCEKVLSAVAIDIKAIKLERSNSFIPYKDLYCSTE